MRRNYHSPQPGNTLYDGKLFDSYLKKDQQDKQNKYSLRVGRAIQLILVYQSDPERGTTRNRPSRTDVTSTLRGSASYTYCAYTSAGPCTGILTLLAKQLIFSTRSRPELHDVCMPQWRLREIENSLHDRQMYVKFRKIKLIRITIQKQLEPNAHGTFLNLHIKINISETNGPIKLEFCMFSTFKI